MKTVFKLYAVAALVAGLSAPAAAVTIGFDDLNVGDIVDDQYSALGADFGGTAQVLADSFFYPAESPSLLVIDSISSPTPGVIRIDAIGDTWRSASGYITANTPITLSAFDAADTLLGFDQLLTANFGGAGTGVAPNAFLSVAALDIAYVTFSDTGNSFSLDTFSFIATAVALPSSLALFAIGTIGFSATRRRPKR